MLAIIVLVVSMLIYASVFKFFEHVDRAKNKRDNEKRLGKFDKHD